MLFDFLCYCILVYVYYFIFFFFFKQKTAYEMRISDWSSDVCSSDLAGGARSSRRHDRFLQSVPFDQTVPDQRSTSSRARAPANARGARGAQRPVQIGRASCRERVCQYV